MIKWFLAAMVFFPVSVLSQSYVDVLKLGLTHNFSSSFEDTEFTTTVNSIDISALIPYTPFNQNSSYLFGADFYYYKIQLFPNSEPADLYSTRLTFGWTGEISKNLNATVLFTPKLASDYDVISFRDVYLGGTILLKNIQNRRLFYKYGVYFSEEAYGFTTTPLFGLYYRSDDDVIEADITLPLSADVNFKLEFFTLGLEYYGMQRSFRIYDYEEQNVYTDQKRLEFSGYFKLRTLSEKAWLKAKIGYAFNSLKVYDVNDAFDFYFINFPSGDKRAQLNPDLKGSLFFKVELLYRFPL